MPSVCIQATSASRVLASQIFLLDEYNREVFERFAPYREWVERRDTFNADDRFPQGDVEGVFGEVERRGQGYAASASRVIRA